MPVVLPSPRDPRLRLAAVIVTLQVLGQTVLHFELSVAQILLAVLTCALLEVGITAWRHRVLAWPASALLTGNGVAFILRVPGTRHGHWWSMRGGGLFVGVAALALVSKYAVRVAGRHVFNPSNLGLLLAFLVLGSARANPQDLWWGPLSPTLVVTLVVIVAGGLWVAGRVGMLGLAASFWLAFAASTGVLAAGGHCMSARWHLGPVCGTHYWWVLMTSPEVLVFLFFMITDPRTAPDDAAGRIRFGVLVAVVAALLAAPASSEFGTKVALLGGLAVVCGARPLVRRIGGRVAGAERRRAGAVVRWTAIAGVAAVCAGVLLVVGGANAPAAAGDRTGVAAATGATSDAGASGAALPPIAVDVDAAVHRLDGSVTETRARAMAAALVDHLTAPQDGPAPSYAFSRLTVVVVRDPTDDQAPPRLGIRAVGTADGAGFTGTFAPGPDGGWVLTGPPP